MIVLFLSVLWGQVSTPVFSWQIDPVLGDFIEIHFDKPSNFLTRFVAERNFKLEPEVDGRFVWSGDGDGIFLPQDLKSNQEYSVSFSNSLLANVSGQVKEVYKFNTPSFALVTPRLLPVNDTRGFKRKDGQVVAFSKALINEKYIDIDLQKRTTTLFESSGKRLAVFDILASGRPYFWQTKGGTILGPTPKGRFTVDWKAPRRFSYLGQVWMPWALHIFEGYYLHGLPYFENGEKYISQYSGGCVRYEDKDAEKIYAFADLGTTVIIH